jgi:hypothetical protein
MPLVKFAETNRRVAVFELIGRQNGLDKRIFGNSDNIFYSDYFIF